MLETPKRPAALFLAPLLAAGLAVVARHAPLRGADVLWQVRSGERILERRGRLPVDLYSFAFRGRPIHDHEAGFEVLVAALHRVGATAALWWGALAFLVVYMAVSAHAARRIAPHTAGRIVGLSLVLAALGTRTELRAELATFVGIALAHAGMRRGFRAAPIVASLLASCFHGLGYWACVVPIAFAVDHALDRRWRDVALTLAIAIGCFVAAELASPGLFRLNLESVSGSVIIEHINELKSPFALLSRGSMAPTFALLVSLLALLGLVRASLRREAILFAMLMVPAFRYSRFVVLPTFAAMPLAIGGIALLVEPLLRRRTATIALPIFAVAATAAVTIALQGSSARIVGFDFASQPVASVDYLIAKRPEGTLFHPYNFGAYLIYRGYPPRGVVIDPRAQMVYPNDYAARYYAAAGDPIAFERWALEAPFDAVLIARSHLGTKPLRAYLALSSAWVLAFEDQVSLVYVRR